jgi:hypothetical protein
MKSRGRVKEHGERAQLRSHFIKERFIQQGKEVNSLKSGKVWGKHS